MHPIQKSDENSRTGKKIFVLMNSLQYHYMEIAMHNFKRKDREMNNQLIPNDNWQTPQRGSNDAEYQIYLNCADNGKGGDITRGGAPLKTYDEWLAS